ncbi:MAG TPA: MBL fold metallo-hydrolase [Candidatus Baltobacteraceae bacterium]|nr:MBL fold metallo-hydrolase [Candidatus Baltobacteraceae bacterium]
MGSTDGGTLYIAGSSSAVPRPGRANSGYVLRAGGCTIAIDFGSGVFSRMREHIEPTALDAVVISHMHADHFFDIVPLRYALRYELERDRPLPVYLPPGGIHVAQTIAKPLKETADFYAGVFDLREYSPDRPLEIGACTVHFTPAVHYVPAYAMRVQTPDGVLGYSADTAPCDAVPALVRDADIFLCEAALGASGKENGERGHLNAREAGELAQRAGVKHLVITHYGASANPKALREAAAQEFSGEVTVADDGMRFTLGRLPRYERPAGGDDTL